MNEILNHTQEFQRITARLIDELFENTTDNCSVPNESMSLSTDKHVLFSVQYTGTVYGEYVLAMDTATAMQMVHKHHSQSSPDEAASHDETPDEEAMEAICEVLNMIVGEAIQSLQLTHAKLTLTSPRVMIGRVRYPAFKTGHGALHTDAGQIECHFCLDRMRLDLATSYQEAMDSLLEVNDSLRDANRHLAEQQAKLVHSEKMASVGVLASGVAHEINNPLFFVDSNLHTLDDYVRVLHSTIGLYDKLCQSMTSESPANESIQDIRNKCDEQDIDFVLEDTKQLMCETRDGVQRIKSIVESLKDFSQVDKGGVTEADLNMVIENTVMLVRGEIPSDCKLETDLLPLPTIACNIAEIGQVIAGLILNAAQAVDENGSITIHTDKGEDQVLVRIVDDGCGIPESDLPRLFEPFFSTKQNGDHPGLGLSIAFSVIEKHGGAIQFRSKPEQGTEVTIRLPTVASRLESLAEANSQSE